MQHGHFRFHPDNGWSDAPQLDSEQTLVLVLGETMYGDDATHFDEIRRRFPNSTIVGASSSGGIFCGDFLNECLAVAAVKFDSTQLRLASTPQRSFEMSRDAGRNLGESLLAHATPDAPLRYVMLLANGIHTNGTELLEGLHGAIGDDVVVTGALAGDGDRFERTWVLDGEKPDFERSVAVGFYGDDLSVSYGCEGGWDIFGVKRRITRAEGNTLYELDGKPALDVYERFLGDHSKDLPGTGLLFPLQIERPDGEGEPIVRTILGIDREARAIHFAGDMPVNAIARFMKANYGRIVDGAEHAGEQAAQGDHGPNPFGIAVSCVGRKSVLQGYGRDELMTVERALPADTLMFGLYSYGEIAPTRPGSRCELHNQTMTVTLLSERAS